MEISEREVRAMVRAVDEQHREGMATMAADIAELHHGEGARLMGPTRHQLTRGVRARRRGDRPRCRDGSPQRSSSARPTHSPVTPDWPRSPSPSSWPRSRPTRPPQPAGRSRRPPCSRLPPPSPATTPSTPPPSEPPRARRRRRSPTPSCSRPSAPQLGAAADEAAHPRDRLRPGERRRRHLPLRARRAHLQGGAAAHGVDPARRVAARRRARHRPGQAGHRLSSPASRPSTPPSTRPSSRSADRADRPKPPTTHDHRRKADHGLLPRPSPPRGPHLAGRARRGAPPAAPAALPGASSVPTRSSADQRRSVVLGVNRRGALQIGGVTILGGALLAACGSDSDNAGTTTARRGRHDRRADDRRRDDHGGARRAPAAPPSVRRAHPAHGVLDRGAGRRRLPDRHRLRPGHHDRRRRRRHALPGAAPGALRAVPVAHHEGRRRALHRCRTRPSSRRIQPTIDGLKDEMGIVALAYDLEVVAAQTYQSNVAALRGSGAERRHHERRRRRGPARRRPGQRARAEPGPGGLPGDRQGRRWPAPASDAERRPSGRCGGLRCAAAALIVVGGIVHLKLYNDGYKDVPDAQPRALVPPERGGVRRDRGGRRGHPTPARAPRRPGARQRDAAGLRPVPRARDLRFHRDRLEPLTGGGDRARSARSPPR